VRGASLQGTEPKASALVVCPECDLVQRQADFSPGDTIRCQRCNSALFRHPDKPLDNAVAWSLTGLVLLALANLFPVLHLSVGGQVTQTSLVSGALALYRAGQPVVAALVVGILIVAPTLLFLLQVAVILPLRLGRLPVQFVRLMRLLTALNHWLMFDVFMLAILVAVVKLSSLAEVIPGPGLWAFLALMLASILSLRTYDSRLLWEHYARLAGRPEVICRTTSGCGLSARERGLIGCTVCGHLSEGQGGIAAQRCPRCSSPLHSRKTESLARTWALLLTSYFLLVPANFLPITITHSLFGVQADTIMSGVLYFWEEGAFDLAIVIFTASIFVPLAKLFALTYLAYSVQTANRRDPLRRTRLYRAVEFVGKWSMLDIFVVALLAQLVQFSTLASIVPGYGAAAFAALVVVTMLATLSFDPRLIWDTQEHQGRRGGIR